MKYEYRITKYNPKYRDDSGRYTREEWTEYSDIGKTFSGEKLTKQMYKRIELNYCKAIIDILSEAKIPKISISNLENRNNVKGIRNGRMISLNEVGAVAGSILRCEYWAKLSLPRKVFVHFGYDYYMYIGIMKYTPIALKNIVDAGLYVEEFTSPYK